MSRNKHSVHMKGQYGVFEATHCHFNTKSQWAHCRGKISACVGVETAVCVYKIYLLSTLHIIVML